MPLSDSSIQATDDPVSLRSRGLFDAQPLPALDRITARLARLLGTSIAGVTLLDGTQTWAKSHYGTPITLSERDLATFHSTIESIDVLTVPDLSRDLRFCEMPLVTEAPRLRFYAGAALRTPEGRAFGALWVGDFQPRELSSDEISLLSDLAALVMDAFVLGGPTPARPADELASALGNRELGAAMRENNAFSAALRSSVVGVLITDPTRPDNPTVLVNPAFETITGYRADEVIGKNCRFLQGPDSSQELIAEMRLAIRERRPFRGLLVNYRKDGTPFWNELAVDPVFDDAGQLIHFVGLQNDVTERVAAQRALRQNEARKAAILDSSLDAIITIDHEGIVLEINPATERIFNYTAEQMLGKRMSDLIVPPAFREAHNRGLGHFMATGEGPVLGQRLELPAMRSDGSEFPIELAINRIRAEGSPMFTGHIRDITTRKRSEEALRLAKEEAERANTAKSDFLSRMSHELRTPLNAILGFSQLLQRRQMEPRQAESVDYIAKAGRHLLDLVNEVLDLARIEAGHTSWSAEVLNVFEVMSESTDLLRLQAQERSVEISVAEECRGRAWFVTADRQRLKQIFVNLLTNAVKYNREYGRVSICCAVAGEEMVAIEISDTGLGIAPGKLERLFVPFERLGAEESGIEGTGIGLALTHRLVGMMGGRVEVSSVAGEGSTFRVLLPRGVAPAEKLLSPETRAAAHPFGCAARTILYVEDHPANLRLMEHVVAEYGGLQLVSCSLGGQAVAFARQHRPELILLDLHLPDLPGGEVLRRLRAEPDLRELPVLIVSADAMSKQASRLLEQGAAGYITKPIEIDSMLRHLHEHLGVATC